MSPCQLLSNIFRAPVTVSCERLPERGKASHFRPRAGNIKWISWPHATNEVSRLEGNSNLTSCYTIEVVSECNSNLRSCYTIEVGM